MGHATFSIEKDSLVELLEEVRNMKPVISIDNATIIFKDNRNYFIMSDKGVELAMDRIYGEDQRKKYKLILRVTP